jgi:hypothetical protein
MLLDYMKKKISKSLSLPEKTARQIEVERLIDEASAESDLDRLHKRISYLIDNPKSAELAPYTIGENWSEMLTLDEAIEYVRHWLKENHFDIGQSCGHLLSLNRRKPWSDYARKTGIPKTNWHRYGRCPYIKGAKYTYSKVVIHKWLEENIRSHAKSIGEKAA